ncbi:hypothetical protein PM080_09285 [Mycobacteroides abscessus subsp. abscessus]|nr:hypothetical protein [Mycobacteroides abscessus]MDB2196252.1 hypothetical protein [Mycobacteroides abscessus subsp. abscessus]MDB2199846.1 hypothetical protein [Mycobacteroides abscessus subsp. abscessus]
MSRPGKSVVYSANATALGDLAEPTRTLGTQVLDAAGKVHGAIADLEWEGEGKDAAVGRADRELAQDKQVVSGYNALADAYQNGAAVMAPMISDLTKTGQGLEADTFAVAEDWTVTDMFDYRAGKFAMMAFGVPEPVATQRMNQLQAERGNEAQNNTASLQQRADALGQADQDTANAISTAKGDIDAAAPLTAGLSGEEGKKDLLDAIAVSKYTGMPVDPAALAKLVAAGTLSQADLDKLARGEKVQIPAGQMAYLYQMSQSLNGMSPEQIKELQRTLPADAQAALAQGLKIVSNPNVEVAGADQIKPYAQGATDATRGTFVPVTGSKANLPAQIAGELSRTDRVTTTEGHKFSDGLKTPDTVTLKGVGAMQDIADILRPGAEGYSNGSEATRGMLAAASEYANADITQRAAEAAQTDPLHYNPPLVSSDEHGNPGGGTPKPNINGALADIVQVASGDHIGIHDLATGAEDKKFLDGMLQENWGDHSDKIGKAFGWVDDDPGNRINSETANRVGHYLSENKDTLQHMPGTNGQTFGSTNAELSRAVAEGMSPYFAELAGADGPAVGGVEAFKNQREMANMFSVLDQDHVSGITANNAALAQQQGLLFDAAKNGGDHYQNVEYSERLQAAMNAGAQDARDYDRAHQQFNALQNDLTKTPQLDLKKIAETAVPFLKPAGEAADFLEGLTPSPALKTDPTTIQGDDYLTRQLEGGTFNNATTKNITTLQGLIAANPAIANDPALQQYFPEGQPDFKKIADDRVGFDAAFSQVTENPSYGYDGTTWNRNVNEGHEINWS